MEDVLSRLGDFGVVPVIAIKNADDTVPLGEALCEGGLPCAEITFRTGAAEEAIKRMTSGFPEMLVGAGTILTVEQVDRAIGAGARFIVSPGFNPVVVRYCLERKIPITPGVSTPTEIETALGYGLTVVKFFPAESLGGLGTLKAISAPYGMIKFIPTGGINIGNFQGYLSFPKVLACGGSWMVKPELIESKSFGEITHLTAEAVAAVHGFCLAHIGLNMGDIGESLAVTKQLCALFHLPFKEGHSSHFAGTMFEVMKEKRRGTHGHIAVQTNNIPRAVAYLARQGLHADPGSEKKSDGVVTAIYMRDEIGGFALHLLQRK